MDVVELTNAIILDVLVSFGGGPISAMDDVVLGQFTDELLRRFPTLRGLLYLPQPNLPTKKTSYRKLDTTMADMCSICMTTHTYREGTKTSCGHCFGRICFDTYIASKSLPITCPICRSEEIALEIFIERKKKAT